MRQQSRNGRDYDPLEPQPSAQDTFKVLGVCCGLLLMVLLVYGQTYNHEFIVCDDDPYIYGNSHVMGGFYWKSYLDNSLWWSLTTCTAGNWHPLTWLSHTVDAQLYGVHDMHPDGVHPPAECWKGPEAGFHHSTSVLLHAAAAIVLFLALRRMTAAFWCSALVAAMFALHPLRVESVAWAAERKDVLSGLFWMLTLFAYGGYVLRPSIGRYLAVVGVFALGLTAKSMLVTLPCVLLLLDFWPLRRWQPKWPASESDVNGGSPISADAKIGTVPRFAPQSIGWLVVEKLPLFALSAAVSVIVAVGQRAMGCMSMTDNVPMDSRIANAAFSAVAYLWKTIWPLNLAIFYPHLAVMGADATARSAMQTRLMWYGIAGALVLAAITLFALWNLRRRPYLAVGWFWYLGVLVPVIGLIQVGAQSMADRYTYLSMIGVTIMVVWGSAELAARSDRLRAAMSIAAVTLLASWTVLTVFQVATWKDSVSVFQHAVEATDDNYFAHNHLGLAYQNAGRTEDAGQEFKEAVRTAPSYDASNANLGVYYMRIKEFDKAVVYFENAVRVNPYAAFHHANLASIYSQQGKLDEAAAQFRRAIDIEPLSPRYHQTLAGVLLRQRKAPAAVAELREVLRLSPNEIIAMKDLAWCLSTNPDASVRNGKEALELAQRANKIAKDRDPVVLIVLAAAYAETGRSEEAVDNASKAMKLAAEQGNQGLANFARNTIRLYESGSPFREAPAPAPGLAPSPSKHDPQQQPK
jgi:protein O-mannosyl-transferase